MRVAASDAPPAGAGPSSSSPTPIQAMMRRDSARSVASRKSSRLPVAGLPDDLINDAPIATKREIQAWYLYDWANSVYSQVAISVLIPILVVDLAKREAGCDPDDDDEWDDCKKGVQFGSISMRPASVAFNFIAFSVLFQALTFVTIGPLADYGNNRKLMLMITSMAGSALTVGFMGMSSPSMWWLAGLLMIVTNVFFGASIVFYNAYLPLLAHAHPDVQGIINVRQRREAEETLMNRMSQYGFGAGYAGGVALLLIALVILFMDPTRLSVRICISLSGVWWMGFSLLSFRYLKERPGPPLPPTVNPYTLGWKQVSVSINRARELPHTFRFLLSYFMFSDGYNTIGTVGVLFGTEVLNASSFEILLLGIEVPLLALAGNYFFLWLQTKKGWTLKTMLFVHLAMLLIIPSYGFLGFIPGLPFGLKAKWELYIFGFIYGLNLGSIQSVARTIFAELVPLGQEAEFFSLFEITDKGSSWMGPLIVAAVFQGTGDMRWSLFYLFLFLGLPIYFLRNLDISTGAAQAKRLGVTRSTSVVSLDEIRRSLSEHRARAASRSHSTTGVPVPTGEDSQLSLRAATAPLPEPVGQEGEQPGEAGSYVDLPGAGVEEAPVEITV